MKVLFIGNSYTSCNDLPGMLHFLSQAGGKPIEPAKVTSGGRTLEWHWRNPATLEAIAEAEWECVVLQDQSMRAIEAPEKLSHAAASLADSIRAVHAHPVLYLTWARQHTPEAQATISRTYMRVAREIDAKVAPVGSAWRSALDSMPDLSLHVADRSHPNMPGTYLAACVFFATLCAKTPVGLPHAFALPSGVTADIPNDIARGLQEMAWASVRDLSEEIASPETLG